MNDLKQDDCDTKAVPNEALSKAGLAEAHGSANPSKWKQTAVFRSAHVEWGTPPESARGSFAAPAGSAWERVNEVFAEADKLEELTKLRMERPGETRESAFEWAKEMYQRYPPSNK